MLNTLMTKRLGVILKIIEINHSFCLVDIGESAIFASLLRRNNTKIS